MECGADRPVAVVRYDAKAGERSLDILRWGLVPYWAKDAKIGCRTINAPMETVDDEALLKPIWQGSVRRGIL